MIRSVKTSLKKVLGNSYCNFEELTKILIKIEDILNSRPLTYAYTDANEPEPLTPSHFLICQRLTTLPDSCSAAEVAQKPGQLTRRWHYRLRMADQFWRRWQKEYLTSPRSAHFTVPNSSSALKQGTLVLVQAHHLPRQLWKTGEVAEVLLGRDGKIRACMVRMPNGAILRRPVQLLYAIEYTDE
ncbi:hypothetical protein MTO96_025977 [Rhipicephalus appendiculatus]